MRVLLINLQSILHYVNDVIVALYSFVDLSSIY